MRLIYEPSAHKNRLFFASALKRKLVSKIKKYTATVGVFDGVHQGHNFILKKTKEQAEKLKVPSLVITFNIPPSQLLSEKFPGCLTDAEEKKKIIDSAGMDYLWVMKTTPSLLKLSGREFINYIFNYARIAKFMVGEDFRFGRQGESDVNYLTKLGEECGFDVAVVQKMKKQGLVISSTLIRDFIKRAEFKRAKLYLGRDYILKGRVVKGTSYGRRLGFPTANIKPLDYVCPLSGVYAAYVILGKNFYLSVLNIGRRPTIVHSDRVVLEAHIINFNRNILGRILKVVFLEKIREEKRFSSPQALKGAIQGDIIRVKRKRYKFPLIFSAQP